MSITLTILIILVSILLGGIVLIQNPKGGGLGSGFGNVNQIGGVKRTADFLEKATWGLAIGLVLLCLFSTWTLGSLNSDVNDFDPTSTEIIDTPVQNTTPDAASEEPVN